DETEAKFQLSVKLPVVRNLFGIGTLYAAYTGTSWWQVYNKEVSAPFRETNHEPELFLAMPTGWQAAGFRLPVVSVGLVHESNGRAQPLSRSWNRIYAEFVAERGNLALSFKPWYRLPESKKQDPMEADGDDNPDITDYLGHFELGAAWRIKDDVLRAQLRRNFRKGNGGLELSWSHPLRSNLKLFTQYYQGYGESLIDYNDYTHRIGVGVSFGDVL
ncbi:MAG: phospholipase A, partial [Steroidobacteraceae bacterium]|nr:phospholipase A [Steroidobacteraceae bacterium]